VRTALQEVLEAEMTEALGAEKGERAAGRQGYRSGYYGRTLITRVGKLELRVPQDRNVDRILLPYKKEDGRPQPLAFP
jgi:putative transposase